MKAKDIVEVNPKKMSGTPVFRGTRVPIQNLFDCFEDSETLEEFLEQFPTVTPRTGQRRPGIVQGKVARQ